MPPTVFPFPMRLALGLLAACTVAVIASGWVALEHESLKADVFGPVGMLLFGVGLVVSVQQLIKRESPLVVTDEGFRTPHTPFVGWHDVISAQIREIHNPKAHRTQPMIEVVLRDPAAYLDRLTGAPAVLAASSRGAGYSPLVVSGATTGVPLEDMLTAMRRHRPALATG
jgi:hypothetical protein